MEAKKRKKSALTQGVYISAAFCYDEKNDIPPWHCREERGAEKL